MKHMKNQNFKLATAWVLAFSAVAGLLVPSLASAITVNGNASISINNTNLASALGGWQVDAFYDQSHNNEFITGATGVPSNGGTFTNMLFPVNTNTANNVHDVAGTPTVAADDRVITGTSFPNNFTSATDQIGLSGMLRVRPSPTATTSLIPGDFTLQKNNGTWNLVSHDFGGAGNTFLQLAPGFSETYNASGELSLSGSLIVGTGSAYTGSGLTWAGFLGGNPANAGVVVGSLNLTPSAVPVPAAVWLFGTALMGLTGFKRRQSSALAA
jgi:hypothetical protein